MLLSIEEKDKVVGEIYKITNIITNKSYIGQTRSHRLNHNKYRPFGYLGRFKDHIHEANSNKKNQSKFLNSALLKYGSDNFTCELLMSCNVSELDFYEIQYISENNTKYPNGYNLTNGGKGFTDMDGKYVCEPFQKKEKSERISTTHSDYTKQLISERLKVSLNNDTHREQMMKRSQHQHISRKFEKFKNVTIDENNIDQYMHMINSDKLGTYIRIIINGIKTTFVGKYETTDTIKNRARIFILDLLKWQRDQIAGNPLEPVLSNK
jgi:hypothetical protein